jgi:SagB-type dehydrogenase family enzyme
MSDELLEFHRDFLKDSLRLKINFSQTDQGRKVPPPPLEKPFEEGAKRISLPGTEDFRQVIRNGDLLSAIANRESRRRFSIVPLSLPELAFLLWSTQGIRSMAAPGVSLRTVPSAGARHSFETYLFVRNVLDLDNGLYRYLPVEHELLFMGEVEGMEPRLVEACLGQGFFGSAAVTFAWATIPYRMEWRYAHCAHRVILMDVGHVCQNLYIACEAVGAGTCGVAAYDQEKIDRLIELDGEEEFVIYLAPVGKI